MADEAAGEVPIDEILDRLPEGTTPQELVKIIARRFSGPLPPPEMFREYNEILPGAAGRILSLAENEQKIRGRDNAKILRNDTARVWGSIIVLLSLVGAAVFCAYLGERFLSVVFVASGMGSAAVSGIIKAFIQRN